MPTKPKTVKDPSMHTYLVTRAGVSSFNHESGSYPVVKGKVALPIADTWYYRHIESGLLKDPDQPAEEEETDEEEEPKE